MDLSLMTWNTGLTEERFTVNAGEIFDYVKKFLDTENSISVLQQIPYKEKQDDHKWNETTIYKQLKTIFNEKDGYRILCNNNFNNGYVKMMTVIITKIALSESDDLIYPNKIKTNREIAATVTLGKSKFTFLGIHAKNGLENKSYLNSLDFNSCADVILGDFNAGNYPESENRGIFNSILKEYVCICNMPTKEICSRGGNLIRKSCIDHIFVKLKYITSCTKVKINDNVNFSDHYPITFKININNIK